MSDTISPYAETIWNVLDEHYAPLRHATELLARAAGVVPRTAKNWLDKRNAPRGDELVRLMASDPHVAMAMRELVISQRAAMQAKTESTRSRHAALGRRLSLENRGASDSYGRLAGPNGGASDDAC